MKSLVIVISLLALAGSVSAVNLVVDYKFDETSGLVAVDSAAVGGLQNGILTNMAGTEWTSPGLRMRSVDADDAVIVDSGGATPLILDDDEFTISLDFTPDSWG